MVVRGFARLHKSVRMKNLKDVRLLWLFHLVLCILRVFLPLFRWTTNLAPFNGHSFLKHFWNNKSNKYSVSISTISLSAHLQQPYVELNTHKNTFLSPHLYPISSTIMYAKKNYAGADVGWLQFLPFSTNIFSQYLHKKNLPPIRICGEGGGRRFSTFRIF